MFLVMMWLYVQLESRSNRSDEAPYRASVEDVESFFSALRLTTNVVDDNILCKVVEDVSDRVFGGKRRMA